ncbi:MAG TPA: glycoside hydrolase family 76 protein [Verrucomicrobiae bacterium]|nr:glycoside hydrolase family 76 protein [Verrucomicrobiae bacterium]
MRVVQIGQWIRAIWLVSLSVMVMRMTLTVRAFTLVDADTLFAAHTKSFYRVTNGFAFYLKSTNGNKLAGFWTEAEQPVLDTYERTINAPQLVMFTNLFRCFLAANGTTWEHNPNNDDIMWMLIALTRGHMLTGDPEFIIVAQTKFHHFYGRAASNTLRGGLWWKLEIRLKNPRMNGTGSIAAFLLGKSTGEVGHFTIATNLFLRECTILFDQKTGRVCDSIHENGRVARFALRYNQGTFVGAANFLGYTNEARLAALYIKNSLTKNQPEKT